MPAKKAVTKTKTPVVNETTISTSEPVKPTSKPQRHRGRKIFVVLLLMALAAGATYYWQHRVATKQQNELQSQINTLNHKVADLQTKNDSLTSQLNDAQAAASQNADTDAITSRVKHIVQTWLSTVGGDQTTTINSLRDQNYITSSLATSLKQPHAVDPVICSQNLADSYVYDSPAILTTTSATITVTGKYQAQNVGIDMSLNKTAGKWIVTAISCESQSQ